MRVSALDCRLQRRNITSTELVKLALQQYLNGDKKEKDITFLVDRKKRKERGSKRIEITLTASELEAIETVMQNTIHPSYQATIVGIIRAYLLNNPIFTINEVVALRKANSHLLTIGRNLNQFVVMVRKGDNKAVTDFFSYSHVWDMYELANAIETHVEHCQNVINSAVQRTSFKQGNKVTRGKIRH